SLTADRGRMTSNTEVGRQDAELSLWGVFRPCILLGQNPLSNSCCRGSYLLNTLMFIIFLWSRNTGWATSSRTLLRMASGRRSLSQARSYWWSLRWVGRL